jgi:hypothetical protein
MNNENLENKVLCTESDKVNFNEVCVWYKIMHNPNSTTYKDVHPGHNLYPCMNNCTGTEPKECYKVLNGNNGKGYSAVNKIIDKVECYKDKIEIQKSAGARYILGDMIGDFEHEYV